jgi:hypothetical protein
MSFRVLVNVILRGLDTFTKEAKQMGVKIINTFTASYLSFMLLPLTILPGSVSSLVSYVAAVHSIRSHATTE